MIFTSSAYVVFVAVILTLYWVIRRRSLQNVVLLIGSYIFYGWITPWFCYLLAFSTLLDYFCGLGMARFPDRRRRFLLLSLIGNLGMLGVFKYFNFFADNVQAALIALGLHVDPFLLSIYLPVGISFYTFQTLSYTIDVYRGQLEVRRNFIDLAVFVSFFPQLVAGPIERAARLLPQVEQPRKWSADILRIAVPLIIRGYLKKLVIADNVAVFADKIFMLESPPLFLLFAGTLAFSIQIYADFSAYTDIARGTANLLGFDLMENFKSPYLAVSPSDFWRRWHISFSTWIRDYLYISLGGSRSSSRVRFLLVLLATMGLSGLWHGAAWHFVWWGFYHGILVFIYHQLGLGGRWKPTGWWRTLLAWCVMSALTLIGWMIFRASSMAWLVSAVRTASWGFSGDALIVAVTVIVYVAVYTIPLLFFLCLERIKALPEWIHAIVYGLALLVIMCFARQDARDFIYFQF